MSKRREGWCPNCWKVCNLEHADDVCVWCVEPLRLSRQFVLHGKLGGGHATSSWLAEDVTSPERPMRFLKRYIHDSAATAARKLVEAEAAFKNLYRALEASSSRLVPRLLQIFQHKESCYCVMDLIPGKTLQEELESTDGLGRIVGNANEVRKLVANVLEALVTLHGQGVLHGTIGPECIVHTPSGEYVLVGYPFAPFAPPPAPPQHVEPSTPGPRSPSRAAACRDGQRNRLWACPGLDLMEGDLYALGTIALRCLTAVLPQAGKAHDLAAYYAARSHASPELAAFLAKLVAATAADRYPNAAQAAEAAAPFLHLAGVAANAAPPAVPVPPPVPAAPAPAAQSPSRRARNGVEQWTIPQRWVSTSPAAEPVPPSSSSVRVVPALYRGERMSVCICGSAAAPYLTSLCLSAVLSMSHPHLVQTYAAYFTPNSCLCLVLDAPPTPFLLSYAQARRAARQPVSSAHKLVLLSGVAAAMAHIYSRPAATCAQLRLPLLLTSDKVLCTDNGHTAKILPLFAPLHGTPLAVQVASGASGGSWSSEPWVEKADVYSFGVVAWELATEEPAWAGATHQAIADAVAEGRRPDSSCAIDPLLAAVIEQCWHQDSSKRPNFDQIKALLTPLLP